jgi:hypothetical protein
MELSSSTGEIAIKVLDTSGDATDEPTKDEYQLTNVPKRCSSIVDLPNELLVQIISHLYNKDLVNLATTCHVLHDLADRSLQEHRRLLLEWSFVSNVNQHYCYLASRVAQQLLDRRLTTYTHSLEIMLEEAPPQPQILNAARDECVVQATHADLHKLWNSQFNLELDIADSWHTTVMAGNIDFVLTAWFTVLDSITHLGLHLNNRDCGRLLRALRSRSEGYLPSVGNLTVVRIEGSSPQAYELLEFYAQLPLIHHLAAGGTVIRGPQFCSTDADSYVSNVKSFVLEGCSLSERHLVALIRSMKTLEEFTYQEDPRNDCDSFKVPKAAIINALRNTARKTLRSLSVIDMTMTWRCIPPLGSLADFDTLRDVTLEFDYILDWLGIKPKSYFPTGLHEQLPRSLRTLLLTRIRQPIPRYPVSLVMDLLLRQKDCCCRPLEHFCELLIMYVEPGAVEELQTGSMLEWSERVGLAIHLQTEDELDVS